MKNSPVKYQFRSIQEADEFVKQHRESELTVKTKVLSQLLNKAACEYGIKEALHPYSPHYFDHPLSPDFAREMYRIGVEAFVKKAVGASQHIHKRRHKLQAFASKYLMCPSVKEANIKPGGASIDVQQLKYWDRTIYAMNRSGFKLLTEQKPVLLE